MNQKILYILILITTIFSCKKTPPDFPTEYQKSKGVYICNEGNYTYGNASLSFYDPETKRTDNQIFYNTNNFPLGDVCSSMAIKDTLGFIVINNSGKISIINTNTFKYIATISGLTSPRYIQFISDTKAYVTDLYNNNITIFNPETFQITGSLHIGNSTENLVKYEDMVFVTSWSYNNKIYKINTLVDVVTDSLTVTKQPKGIVLDKNNKLWILSDGGFPGIPNGQDTAALTKIDAQTFTVEKIYKFTSIEASPGQLKINSSKDTLFFINGSWSSEENTNYGVYKMSVHSASLPDAPFITQNRHLFYGLGVDPVTSDIYVSDAIDYLQKGLIYRYSQSGSLIDSVKADIIPGYFCFKP